MSRLLPEFASGRLMHRRALTAAAEGRRAEAERWFEAAAGQYRHELAVEPLARLRVHQLMVRARSGASGSVESSAMLEIIRRLNRLDRLESLEAPFALGDAREVLADWIGRTEQGIERPALMLVSAPAPGLPVGAELPAAQAA